MTLSLAVAVTVVVTVLRGRISGSVTYNPSRRAGTYTAAGVTVVCKNDVQSAEGSPEGNPPAAEMLVDGMSEDGVFLAD